MAGIFFYYRTRFDQFHGHSVHKFAGIVIQQRGYRVVVHHNVFGRAVGQCQCHGIHLAPFTGTHIEFLHMFEDRIPGDVFHDIDKTIVCRAAGVGCRSGPGGIAFRLGGRRLCGLCTVRRGRNIVGMRMLFRLFCSSGLRRPWFVPVFRRRSIQDFLREIFFQLFFD